MIIINEVKIFPIFLRGFGKKGLKNGKNMKEYSRRARTYLLVVFLLEELLVRGCVVAELQKC